MGSLASALEQGTAALCGGKRWERHTATAAKFWQMVSDYLETLDAKNLKVYQDGFVSDGDLGKKIIEEGMRRGSKNYEIILNLLNRGAEIVSTEDMALLQEEYGHIAKDTDDILQVLKNNFSIIFQELKRLENKVEMGLRIFWDVDNVFEYFFEEGQRVGKLPR